MSNWDSNVQKILELGCQLCGIPYGQWGGGNIETGAPMWAIDKTLPKLSDISSCNCAGLINLLLRSLGKSLPSVQQHGRGGTAAYTSYYRDELQITETFKCGTVYPAGTLLLRDYLNNKDQGHVAVIYYRSDNIARVLQSHYTNDTKIYPGVCMDETLTHSHTRNGYQYIVKPNRWLT
jgi:hypothetical protein